MTTPVYLALQNQVHEDLFHLYSIVQFRHGIFNFNFDTICETSGDSYRQLLPRDLN